MAKDRYDKYVGYGKYRLDDERVTKYADACYRNSGRNFRKAYEKVNGYIGQVPSLDKRQFLNCVCDSLQRYLD